MKPFTTTKICGITRTEDALAACAAGAHALGFNFSAKSPRCITPDQACSIISALPSWITTVGIFVEQNPETIAAICQHTNLHAAQLHSDTYTPEDARAIQGVSIIKVFRPEADFNTNTVLAYAKASGVNTFLFDTYNPAMAGGTGKIIDRSLARRILGELGNKVHTILAGGLTPDNVAEAIRYCKPHCVDTASGVETAPGIKNSTAIHAFLAAVRKAQA